MTKIWVACTNSVSHALPSTYSMTIHRWRRVSKEQNMLTTKGFSAKVRMSRSTNACWIWFLRSRFCLLIFFIAKRCRVSRCLTKYTALRSNREDEICFIHIYILVLSNFRVFWEWIAIFSPIRSVADEFDSLEVWFTGRFDGFELPLRESQIKDSVQWK